MAAVMVREPEGLAAGRVGSSSLPGHMRAGQRPSWCSLALWGTLPSLSQDKTLKCTVYRIRGTVSASNYIQLPKTSAQSLGLTGRYLYLLFRPLSTKHFVIHLDLSTEVLHLGAGSAVGALHPRGHLLSPDSHLCPCRTARSFVYPFPTSSRNSSLQPRGFSSPLFVKGHPGKVTQRWDMNGTGRVRERQPESGLGSRAGPGAGGAGPVGLLYGLEWGSLSGGHMVLATGMGSGQGQKALWAGW